MIIIIKKPGYCCGQQISASQSVPVGQCREEKKAGTVQYEIWNGLKQMEEIDVEENCFGETAGISTWGTGNYAVFAIRRTAGNEELICLANFSEYGQNAWLNCLEGEYEDLFTGEKLEMNSVWMNPYQYRWCLVKK